MKIFRLLYLSGLAMTLLLSPLAGEAAMVSQVSSDAGGGYFATPYMVRGQFMFVNHVSRRTLRTLVELQQHHEEQVAVQRYL